MYAAKIFYNIGSDSTGVPSLEDNLKHLKEELICAKIAENSLSAFNCDAREKRISVFGISFSTYRQNYLNAKESDLCIAQSFIITVAEGPDQGLSWLVDLFLDNGGMHKFSGTLQAGFNNDLVGISCDAFAHYSFHNSKRSAVFVDIQGVQQTLLAHCIILFDYFHSTGIIGPKIISGLR